MEIRKEYDFSSGVRGKHAARFPKGNKLWEQYFRPAAVENVQTWLSYSLLQIQEVEAALITYMALIWQDSPKAAGRKVATLVESAQGKTWTRLLADLQQHGRAGQELEEQLRQHLDHRSWLVHKSGYETESALADPEEMKSLAQRFEKISAEAMSLRKRLLHLLNQRLSKMGMSPKEIDSKRGDVIERWRAA